MSLYGLNQRQDRDFGFHLILDLTVFHLAALQGSSTLAKACMVKTKHIFSIKCQSRGAAATVFRGGCFVRVNMDQLERRRQAKQSVFYFICDIRLPLCIYQEHPIRFLSLIVTCVVIL